MPKSEDLSNKNDERRIIFMKDKLIETIENNKLRPDDTFRFHCTQCGQCCINREDILLNAKDIFYIARKLGITPEELIEKYGEVYIGHSSHIPVVRLKPVGKDRRCPFLDSAGEKCLIHEVKPVVCAMFPIGRAAIRDADGSGDGTKIEYFFADPKCGDGNEIHTLRDWLDNFGIPLEDEVFRVWQQVIVDLSLACTKLGKILDENKMNLFWNTVLYFMCLNYNTEGDFFSQFQSNMDSLRELSGMTSALPEMVDTGEQPVIKIKAKPVQWNERIAFECQKCGACCRHIKKSVPVDSSDAFRLAQFFQRKETEPVNMEEILCRYADPVLLDKCGYFIYVLKTTGPEDACIFLRENMCTIQEAKPLTCRAYPFFAEPNGSGSFNYYLSMEQTHHFSGRKIKARDWMKRNFSIEDRAFVNENVAVTSEISKLLRRIPDSRKNEAMFFFMKFRYSEYDLDQPFLEQAKHNNELLLAHLRELAQG